MARAPSVWFHYDDHFPGDIIHQSVLIPHDGVTLDTYYCCMQWNTGGEGGGYCGLQDHPNGRALIYSVWDPIQSTLPIKPAFTGIWTETQRFGSEGTGLKSMNFAIGWQPDQWYTLVSRVWNYGSHSNFGFWIYDETDKQWTHVLTVDFPVKSVMFNTSTGSFVEDWAGTGDSMRKAFLRDGFKRKSDGTWFPFASGKFDVVRGTGTANHSDNYDAGRIQDRYYLVSGGTTQPTQGLGTSKRFDVQTHLEPTEKPIDFTITTATPKLVTWSVPVSSTPQFKYTINLGSHLVAMDITTEVRSHVLSGANVGDTVTVILEDILGRITTKKATVTDED
ncbi:uncharacterized protein LOC124267907 [Haliotis rubra]|uniref:uncharacterized protein LOC124267907 n=1 Tax=Haliotis rubra TaxID=36100 RepID=UPI001EE5FB97|nr:uncharacterized protein LOC124267907 [Haliotis rubra]